MATPGIDPSFYADFGGLTELKKNVEANDPRAIRAAAQQFESLFTEMMLKSMREANLGQGLGESDQSDFYQDMYDQQLSLQISQGKGLGLADMLVQQLTRRGLIHGGGSAAGSGSSGPGAQGGSGAGAGAGVGAPASAGAASSATGAPTSRRVGGLPTGSGKAVTDRERIGFVRALTPYAQKAGALLGVSPDSLIGQAALETGWGQHVPGSDGGLSSNNLFGVKAQAGWRGASVDAATTEYRGGTAASEVQSFRAYSSLQQGVNDYVTLLRRKPGYQAALGTGEDVGAFAAGLQRGGYATDPDYVQKLSATVASVRALRAADGAAADGAAADGAAALKLQAGGPISGGQTSGGEAPA
jgi:peptidoglycan hydrolase FlgJ